MSIKLRNLFVFPEAQVVSLESDEKGQTVRLQVRGMICGL